MELLRVGNRGVLGTAVVAVAVLILAQACSSDSRGPVATWVFPPEIQEQGVMYTMVPPFVTGRLSITYRCISIQDEASGEVHTLIWNEGDVEFDQSTMTLSFDGPVLFRRVDLHDGDRVSAGGSDSESELLQIRRSPGPGCPSSVILVTAVSFTGFRSN